MVYTLVNKKLFKDKNLIEYKFNIINNPNPDNEDEYTKVLVNINPRTRTVRSMKVLHPQIDEYGAIVNPSISYNEIMNDYDSMIPKKNYSKKYHK